MKRTVLILLALTASLIVRSQDVDSTLVGRNIYSIMPSKVSLDEPASVRNAVRERMAFNDNHKVHGFRIRIYFDNGQNARSESSAVLGRFCSEFPNVTAYRKFDNSYFKVTVGSYRNRSDAMRELEKIKAYFPSAFIVEEDMKFPSF